MLIVLSVAHGKWWCGQSDRPWYHQYCRGKWGNKTGSHSKPPLVRAIFTK